MINTLRAVLVLAACSAAGCEVTISTRPAERPGERPKARDTDDIEVPARPSVEPLFVPLCFDLTGDGRVGREDLERYAALYGAGDPLADLNFDGVVDERDLAIAYAAVDRGGAGCPERFTVHWSVTGETDGRRVDLTGLPIRRDTVIMYQRDAGKYPIAGYHVMLESDGDLGNWESHYDTWTREHLLELGRVVIRRIPSDGDVRYGVIDYEASMPVWSFVSAYQRGAASSWETAVARINTPTLDASFVERVGFEAPRGASGWASLERSDRDALLEASWNYFGRDFYTRTFALLRELRPSVAWGVYGVPKALVNVPAPRMRRAMNDDFGWLIGLSDFLAPSFYRMPYVQHDGSLPGCSSSSGEALVAWYEANMAEARRLRDRFAPGRPILPYVWPHYHPTSPCVTDRARLPVLSDENMRAMLTLPRQFGADGLFLWHHFHPEGSARQWLDPHALWRDLHARFKPVLTGTGIP